MRVTSERVLSLAITLGEEGKRLSPALFASGTRTLILVTNGGYTNVMCVTKNLPSDLIADTAWCAGPNLTTMVLETSGESQTSEQLVELQDAVEDVGQWVDRLRGGRLRGLHRREHAGEHEAGVHGAVWDVQLVDSAIVRGHHTVNLDRTGGGERREHAVLRSVLGHAQNAGAEASGQLKLITSGEELGSHSKAFSVEEEVVTSRTELAALVLDREEGGWA